MNEEPGSTSLDITVIARDASWRETEPQAEALARRAAEAAFLHVSAHPRLGRRAEATVVLADDALVRNLNNTFRGQDRPTNVLSFGNLEGPVPSGQPGLVGDVVLARETVLREAAEQGKTLGDHLTHLVVHGILHLLGYDHDDEPGAREMESLEVSILADLGIADPYRDGEHDEDVSR